MSIVVPCVHCGRSLKIPADAAGKKLRCPRCQKILVAQADLEVGPAADAIQSMPLSPPKPARSAEIQPPRAAAGKPAKKPPPLPAEDDLEEDGPEEMAPLTFKVAVKK